MSWIPRILLSVVFYALFLFGWEARLNWGRYSRAETAMPLLAIEGNQVLPFAPGHAENRGPPLPIPHSLEVQVGSLRPRWPLDLWLGKSPRVRLFGLRRKLQVDSSAEDLPWGGGTDPLFDLLETLGPSARWIFPRLEVQKTWLEVPSPWLRSEPGPPRVFSLEWTPTGPKWLRDAELEKP